MFGNMLTFRFLSLMLCVVWISQAVVNDIEETENEVLDKSSLLTDSISLGKWNIISNLILMLSKDVHFLKSQLSEIQRQGHVTLKSLKRYRCKPEPKYGKYYQPPGHNSFCGHSVVELSE